MKFILFILRVTFGLVFILSGFFKLMDPVGTGLIITEYLKSMYLGFLSFGSPFYGMCLSILELLVGISIFMRLRMRYASFIGLCLTAFFTLLTLFLALFNPITDCGCFGEAVHLTNWQTFFKNIILLVCIIPVFIYRKKFPRVAPAAAEWVYIGFFGVLALVTTVISYATLPYVEFGEFKAGANISLKLDEVNENKEYNTFFIYEKGDVRKEFTIDELPDTTWTYVDTKSDAASQEGAAFDFSVFDLDDNDLTQLILDSDRPQFLFTLRDPGKIPSAFWDDISSLTDSILARGWDAYLLIPGYDMMKGTPMEKDSVLMSHTVYSDYKTIISLNRSNGGVAYLNDGLVVKKWSKFYLDNEEKILRVAAMDPDMAAAKVNIFQRMVSEISILFIFITIIIFRYVCGIIYGYKPKLLVKPRKLREKKSTSDTD